MSFLYQLQIASVVYVLLVLLDRKELQGSLDLLEILGVPVFLDRQANKDHRDHRDQEACEEKMAVMEFQVNTNYSG